MARYFFQVELGGMRPDREGSEHPSLAAARIQAVRSLSEIIDEKRDTFWDDQPVRVAVFDEAHHLLFTIVAAVHGV